MFRGLGVQWVRGFGVQGEAGGGWRRKEEEGEDVVGRRDKTCLNLGAGQPEVKKKSALAHKKHFGGKKFEM